MAGRHDNPEYDRADFPPGGDSYHVFQRKSGAISLEDFFLTD